MDEQFYDSNNSYENPSQEIPVYTPPTPKKREKKNRMGLRICALALVFALLGGALGAGGVIWYESSRGQTGTTSKNETAMLQGIRESSVLNTVTVDTGKEMTAAEVYAANVNSTVGITTSITTNYWGFQTTSAAAGSGFILTEDGYILTNYHVVENSNSITVAMYNGDTYDAQYVGGDEDYDIAVIKVDATDLQPVTLGDSDTLNVGDHVLAIGNPLGELTFSMSEGIASSVNRAINVDGTPFNMIQVTASINPGNSGGPLLNSYGEVIGIVSAKYSSYASESVEGLGFAIPINDVVAMIEDIMTNGYVTNKPYLAITGGTMTSQMAAQYRYDVDSGVFVYSVEEGGAADKAGLKMGDVIIKVDDTDITSMEDLTAVKKQYSAGDTATFTIYREGQETTVEVTWDSVPADQQTNQQEASSSSDQNSQYDGSYNPFEDFFRYFYGGGYSGSSAHEAA